MILQYMQYDTGLLLFGYNPVLLKQCVNWYPSKMSFSKNQNQTQNKTKPNKNKSTLTTTQPHFFVPQRKIYDLQLLVSLKLELLACKTGAIDIYMHVFLVCGSWKAQNCILSFPLHKFTAALVHVETYLMKWNLMPLSRLICL